MSDVRSWLGLVVAASLLAHVQPAAAQQCAYVANARSSSLSVINTETRSVVATIPLPVQPTPTPDDGDGSVEFGPVDVAIRPTTGIAYVGTSTNVVFVVDTLRSVVTATIELDATRKDLAITPPGIAVAADGAHAYVTSFFSGTVSVVDLGTSTVSNSLAVAGPEGIVLSPDGRYAYVAGLMGVTVIDARTQSVRAVIAPLMPPASGVAITPNGARVYTTQLGDGTNDRLTVIDTRAGIPITIIPAGANGRGPSGVAITPDGGTAYVANRNANTVSVIDTTTNSITTSIEVEQFPMGVAITADGSLVFVTNFQSGSVSVIAAATQTVVASIPVGAGPNGVAIALVPDGCPACAGDCNADGAVTIDELVTGVSIALEHQPLGNCPVFDANADGAVTVDEIVQAVNAALSACQ